MSTLGGAASPNYTIGRWTSLHDEAVKLVAEDRLTDVEIAAQLGKTKKTLENWKQDPQFRERVDAYREEVRAALVARGIREKENRIRTYNDIHGKLLQVIEERAADPNLAHVPGGKTGLIVAKPIHAKVYEESPVMLGDPDEPEFITDRAYLNSVKRSVIEFEYAVDTGTLKELREVSKQAAIEVGEWNEKEPGKATALDVLSALAAFGRGEFDAPAPKRLPPATATAIEPDEDWGMPSA